MNERLVKILQSVHFGKLILKNRIFMSTMTRLRADPKTCKTTKIMEEYYEQRSSAGLIFSEPLIISIEGLVGYGCPGIWNDSFIDGWQRITDKVHNNNGVIFATLSHGGRISHYSFNDNQPALAPSELDDEFYLPLTNDKVLSTKSKEMTDDDIKYIFENFYQAAIRVKKAGFDGINLHASSGALVESFIKSSTNKRKDKWGKLGGLEFPLTIIKIFKEVFEKDKICIKLGPVSQFNKIYENNPIKKYSILIEKLIDLEIGMIEIKETSNDIMYEEFDLKPNEQIPSCIGLFSPMIRKKNNCKVIANFGTKNIQDGIFIINNDISDFVSCGSFYISNPNLPEKLIKNEELILPDPKYFYNHSPDGYITY
jgi:N-ethylmaleimide reductase